ncbi:MAG: hypothetical protein ACI89L_002699 [Phycisphaerales bacterium]|jgi:hypothetical protein
MRHTITIAVVIALAGTAAAGEPATGSLVPTRSAGVLYINLETGERSLTRYNIADPIEIDAVNTAALFDYWMSVDENPCWDDPRGDGFGWLADDTFGDGPTQPTVGWDYGDLPFDSQITGIQIKVITLATEDTDSNGDGVLDSGLDAVAVYYDGLSDGARSSNVPPTAVIRVESVPGVGSADPADTIQFPDFDVIVDFGGEWFELGDSDGHDLGELYLSGAAPGRDVSAIITCGTTITSLTTCTTRDLPLPDGLADVQYLQYYAQHGTDSKVTADSTFIGLGTPEGTVAFSTFTTTTTTLCTTPTGGTVTCTVTITVTSTYFTAGALPQGQAAYESFGVGTLGRGGDTTNIDSSSGGCCFWFGGLDCAGFLAQLVEEPQFNETYYNFNPYAQLAHGLFASEPFEPCPNLDYNGDSVVDNADIRSFIEAFLTHQPSAERNGDQVFDNSDIRDFVRSFLVCVG